MHNYVLYGAGGHAKVVVDSLLSDGKSIYTCIDSYKSGTFCGIPLNQSLEPLSSNFNAIIAIGDNKVRKIIADENTFTFGIVKHSSALMASTVKIGVGSMILHRSILQTECKIGKHVIINTKASIDHDCTIDDFVHIAPGSVLCGNVKVGEGTLIGAGTTIIPNIKIGKWCTIGAGSVIIKDVPDYAVVVGNPGRIIKMNQHD